MIDVIQIYKSKEIFTKSSYTPENRRLFHYMETEYSSSQGYLEKETLVLPLETTELPDLQTADLVIVQDIIGMESLASDRSILAFRQIKMPKSFEIFKIQKSDNGIYELYIDYKANSAVIGIPERENHKICNLKKNTPIRYRINGKSDFTLTGRKERTFNEFDFFIEWTGTAEKMEFRSLNEIKRTKIVPVNQYKMIDERKILR